MNAAKYFTEIYRWIQKDKILHWDSFSINNATNEYLHRMNLASTNNISKELWAQWHGDTSKKRTRRRNSAIDLATDELKRQIESKKEIHAQQLVDKECRANKRFKVINNTNSENIVETADIKQDETIQNNSDNIIAEQTVHTDDERMENNSNIDVSVDQIEFDAAELEAEVQKLVDNDNRFIIKNIIIAIMLNKKQIKHDNLIFEVQTQLSTSNTTFTIQFIKVVLSEMLTTEQYVRRNANNRELYYCPADTSDTDTYNIEEKQIELIESNHPNESQTNTQSEPIEEKKEQTRLIATVKSTLKYMKLTLTHTKAKKVQECIITWILTDKHELQDVKYRLATAHKTHNVTAYWVRSQRIEFIIDLLVGMFNVNRNGMFVVEAQIIFEILMFHNTQIWKV